jgi:MFS family permease
VGKIDLRDLKKHTAIVLLVVAALIYMHGQRGTDAFANVYFTDGLGIGIAEASLLYSMLKVAGLFSAPVCGRLSDTYGRKRILIILVFVESISLYAITVVPVILIAVPCIIFGFASFGLLTVGEALLADITPEKQRAALFGVMVTVNFAPYLYLTLALFALADLQMYTLGFIILSLVMPLSIPLIIGIGTGNANRRPDVVATPQS